MEALYNKMNEFLANELVLNMKIHNIHWYLQGSTFYPLHALLDGFYDESQERIDAVAEQLLIVGGKPIGSLKAALDLTSIVEREDHFVDGLQGIAHLIPDYDFQHKLAISIIDLADSLRDHSTADYFTTVINDLGKRLWMMRAYVK